jgi:hypothetical protein
VLCFACSAVVRGHRQGFEWQSVTEAICEVVARRRLKLVGAMSGCGTCARISSWFPAFSVLFPDVGQWVESLGRGSGCLKGLLKELHTGPIELLTMVLCLFSDSNIKKMSPEFFIEHALHVRVLRREYAQVHGESPHPGVLSGLATSCCVGALCRSHTCPGLQDPFGAC